MKLHCPICRTATARDTHADFPFCSERCRLLDLGNWAMQKYVISQPALDLDEQDAKETVGRTGDDSDE